MGKILYKQYVIHILNVSEVVDDNGNEKNVLWCAKNAI